MSWRLLLFCLATSAYAQDPFEIQVFENGKLPWGAFTYEAHTNYVIQGPPPRQFHFSSEWTAGITDEFRFGAVVLTAIGPGAEMQYAGIRILPHYAPRSWRLPVNLGLATEFSFERPGFEENTRTMEIRGILEKHIGRLQLDSNLVGSRALPGPGVREGWSLEPSGRIGWQVSRTLAPSLEYYGELGPVTAFLPGRRQVHLLLPGADWKIRERVTWSLGVGFGLTGAGSQVVAKSRFEFEFGRVHP